MEIISARIEHLDQIQNLSSKLILDDYENYDKTVDINRSHSEDWENFFRNWIIDNNSCIYIAIDNNKVIWYVYGWIYSSVSWRIWTKHIAELYNFFVDEEYRSAGVGWKLYQSFLDWVKLQNVDRLKVVASAANQQAIKFYKKNSFEEYTITLETSL